MLKTMSCKLGEITISPATVDDAEKLLDIYAPYVRDTAITFEYEVPTLEEFKERIKNISSKYPYIKAEQNGKILGYAYAGSFKGRKAYDYSVETTIYLERSLHEKGLGKVLYTVLEDSLKDMGILNMNACIAIAKESDPYLTNASMYFHEAMGFKLVGTFHDSGYKFDTWYDMIWMEKMLGEHTNNLQPVKFGEWKII